MENTKPQPHDYHVTHNGVRIAIGITVDVFYEIKCLKFEDGEWVFVALVKNVADRMNKGATPAEIINELLEKVNKQLFLGEDELAPMPENLQSTMLELALLVRDNIVYSPEGFSLK